MRKQTKVLEVSLEMKIFNLFSCRDLTLSAISKRLLICHGGMNGKTNNNKLREIKPSIVPLVGSSNKRWDIILSHLGVGPLVGSSNKRWDIILTRLRIRHTKFSHGYLINK